MRAMFLLVMCLVITEQAVSIQFCREDQVLCRNGRQCIEKSSVCNNRGDCLDASDEFDCAWSGYTWCNFCNNSTCGWQVDGLMQAEDRCGLVPNISLSDDRQLPFSMVSPPLKSLSKQCLLQFTVRPNQPWCKELFIFYQKTDGTVEPLDFLHGYELCWNYGPFHLPHINELDRLIINGTIYNYNYHSYISDIRFIDCDPTKIALNEDFDEPELGFNSTSWRASNRFTFWTHLYDEHGGYLSNNQNFLAEIRSPLLVKSKRGKCVTFDYMMIGKKNHLQMTKINFALKNTETTIWSTGNSTDSVWKSASVFLDTTTDMDIGFISTAIDGQVLLDNVVFTGGRCAK